MYQKKKVLIIDDEVDLCLLMKTYLTRKNYEVYYYHTLKEGMEQVKNIEPDIIFLDNNLPDGLGWDKAAWLLSQFPQIQLHLISAYHPDTPNIQSNSFKVWEKPITLKDLEFFLEQRRKIV
jgi:DNA-binding response OmpR family regulator